VLTSAVAISVGSFRNISPTAAFDARPCAVQAVNIRPVMNRSVGARPGIEIDPSDRNGLGEVDPLLAALSHRIDNGVTIPMLAGLGVQQPSSQIVDTINPKDSRILKGLGLKR